MNLWESFVNWIPLSLPLLFVFVTTGPFSYRCSVACLRLPCVSVTRRQHLQVSRDIWEGIHCSVLMNLRAAGFLSVLSLAEKGSQKKAHLTGRWVKIYLISLCAIFRIVPPSPPLLRQHHILLSPVLTQRAMLSIFALDQRQSNGMSVSGVTDVLDVH